MAATLYRQHEITKLMEMHKRALFESWRSPSPKDRKRRRFNEFEKVRCISAEPEPESPGIGFEIDLCQNLRTDSFAITLYAEIHPRPMLPICRYDIHDTPHENPEWYPPCLIEGGRFHRHVYSERVILERGPEDWHACADILDLYCGGTPMNQLERLKISFIGDLKISFEDPDTRNQMLAFG